MNLNEFNSPLPKPWLDINANSLNAVSISADTFVVSDLNADVLNFTNQLGPVANPTLGTLNLYSDSTGFLSTIDPFGDVDKLLLDDGSVPMTGDLNMNSNDINNTKSVLFTSGIALGNVAAAGGVAIGVNAVSGNNSSVGIGNDAVASGNGSIALGRFSTCSANNSLAIGISSSNSGAAVGGIAFGRNTVNTGNNGISIGTSSNCSSTNGLCIGNACSCSADDSIALGSGANNSVASSCLIGSGLLVNVRPNNDGLCDLGTNTNQFRDEYLSRKLLIDGDQAQSSKYSTYDDISLSNQAVAADISSTVSSVGSLTFSPLALGAVLDFQFNFLVSSVAGDTVTFRYYTNGNLLFNHAIVYPALTVNEPGNIHTFITVRNGAIQVNSMQTVSGVVTMITSSAIVFDRTINNTFSITCECPASDVTNNQLFICSQFKSV